jgi:hypothetical protein
MFSGCVIGTNADAFLGHDSVQQQQKSPRKAGFFPFSILSSEYQVGRKKLPTFFG